MVSFMFGVLGSVAFWVIYLLVAFFVGSILLKHLAPVTFKAIVTGETDKYFEPAVAFMATVGCFLLWPIVLAFAIIIYSLKFIIEKIFWPSFCRGVKKVAAIVPDIEIKKTE